MDDEIQGCPALLALGERRLARSGEGFRAIDSRRLLQQGYIDRILRRRLPGQRDKAPSKILVFRVDEKN